MTNKLPSTNLKQFPRLAQNILRVNCPELAEMAKLNYHNFKKNDENETSIQL